MQHSRLRFRGARHAPLGERPPSARLQHDGGGIVMFSVLRVRVSSRTDVLHERRTTGRRTGRDKRSGAGHRVHGEVNLSADGTLQGVPLSDWNVNEPGCE